MHIPDGYLSPQTYIPLFGVFVATAAIAVKKVKKFLIIVLPPSVKKDSGWNCTPKTGSFL